MRWPAAGQPVGQQGLQHSASGPTRSSGSSRGGSGQTRDPGACGGCGRSFGDEPSACARQVHRVVRRLPAGCIVAMEASSSAHHWARKLIGFGLDARIISAQLVSPYRSEGATGKNDANDAAAICEAASRPTCCAYTGCAKHQGRPTACINRVRGLLAEFGLFSVSASPSITRHASNTNSIRFGNEKTKPLTTSEVPVKGSGASCKGYCVGKRVSENDWPKLTCAPIEQSDYDAENEHRNGANRPLIEVIHDADKQTHANGKGRPRRTKPLNKVANKECFFIEPIDHADCYDQRERNLGPGHHVRDGLPRILAGGKDLSDSKPKYCGGKKDSDTRQATLPAWGRQQTPKGIAPCTEQHQRECPKDELHDDELDEGRVAECCAPRETGGYRRNRAENEPAETDDNYGQRFEWRCGWCLWFRQALRPNVK